MVPKSPDRVPWVPLGLVLLASAVLKYWLVSAGRVPFNADEAVVGLMARHILQGERPVFFYGQAYMGSLDAWLVAAGFSLFGDEVWVIRLIQALLYLLVLVTSVCLGKAALGSWRAGIIAGCLLAVPAVNITLYTTASLGGYVEALLIGNLTLLAAIRIAKYIRKGRHAPGWLWLSIGFLAGLGLWAFGLTLVYSLPAGLWLAWLLIKPLARPDAAIKPGNREIIKTLFTAFLLVFLGGLLGSAPWWGYAVQHGLDPLLVELRGGNIAGVEGLPPFAAFGQHLLSLVLLGGSVIFGLRPPWEVRWLALPLLPLALAFWLAVLFFAVKRGGRPLLWGIILILCLGFLFTPFGADPSGRYFLPLAVPLALFAADFLLFLSKRSGPSAWGLLGLVVVFNLWGTLQSAHQWPPGLTTQFNASTQIDPRSMEELATFLEKQDIQWGYTNYWVAYPLAFLSNEELIFAPRLPYHSDLRYTQRDDRYAPYDHLVASAVHPAFITSRHPVLDTCLRQVFIQRGARWKEAQVGDFRVFYNLSMKISPDSFGFLNRPDPELNTRLGMGSAP